MPAIDPKGNFALIAQSSEPRHQEREMGSQNHSEWSGTKPRGGFLTSPAGLVLIGFLTIAGIYLWLEHRAHLLGALVWLPLLACPLMHLFMHHRHSGRTGPGHTHDGGERK
jgi:hypothetical protein